MYDDIEEDLGKIGRASDNEERCVICGETIPPDEMGEMHDPAMYDQDLTEEERIVASEKDPSHGVVHAQCGFDRGWVVS